MLPSAAAAAAATSVTDFDSHDKKEKNQSRVSWGRICRGSQLQHMSGKDKAHSSAALSRNGKLENFCAWKKQLALILLRENWSFFF